MASGTEKASGWSMSHVATFQADREVEVARACDETRRRSADRPPGG